MWDEAKLFGVFAVTLFVAILLLMCVGAGLSVANQHWNCNSYKVAPTKVMAGTCYVQDSRGKWVTLDSYVKVTNNSVRLEGEKEDLQ